MYFDFYLTVKLPPSVPRRCWFGPKTCKKPASILSSILGHTYIWPFFVFVFLDQPRNRSCSGLRSRLTGHDRWTMDLTRDFYPTPLVWIAITMRYFSTWGSSGSYCIFQQLIWFWFSRYDSITRVLQQWCDMILDIFNDYWDAMTFLTMHTGYSISLRFFSNWLQILFNDCIFHVCCCISLLWSRYISWCLTVVA